MRGILLIGNRLQKPDIALYYCHGSVIFIEFRIALSLIIIYPGGGFCMGSVYFYLEFLMAWLSLLKDYGFQNPAVFALEYTLAPDAVYPSQVLETLAGYRYLVSEVGDPDKICVAGDSAGATLILSMLLYISSQKSKDIGLPGCSILISPWITLVSDKKSRSNSDYLDKDVLHKYAHLYVGEADPNKPLQSPGNCTDTVTWSKSRPLNGWLIVYGSEEVLKPEIEDFTEMLQEAGIGIEREELLGFVHAWPIVVFYLGSQEQQQTAPLRNLVEFIGNRVKTA